MELLRIYDCLCDRTRLRLLHLLSAGPLCVCHLQESLEEPQAKISKHLAYLKRHGLVEAERSGHWVVYRLPSRRTAALEANLACLQDCVREEKLFKADAERLRRLRTALGCDCPAPVRAVSGKRRP